MYNVCVCSRRSSSSFDVFIAFFFLSRNKIVCTQYRRTPIEFLMHLPAAAYHMQKKQDEKNWCIMYIYKIVMFFLSCKCVEKKVSDVNNVRRHQQTTIVMHRLIHLLIYFFASYFLCLWSLFANTSTRLEFFIWFCDFCSLLPLTGTSQA